MYARSADIAQILLTNGADVNAKNKKGNFVLFNNDIIVNQQYIFKWDKADFSSAFN